MSQVDSFMKLVEAIALEAWIFKKDCTECKHTECYVCYLLDKADNKEERDAKSSD